MKIFPAILLLISLGLTSCGRKGDLEYLPGDENKRPKFDNMIEENV